MLITQRSQVQILPPLQSKTAGQGAIPSQEWRSVSVPRRASVPRCVPVASESADAVTSVVARWPAPAGRLDVVVGMRARFGRFRADGEMSTPIWVALLWCLFIARGAWPVRVMGLAVSVWAPSADVQLRGSRPLWRAPFPPVVRCTLADQVRGEHDVGEVAELPEFLRRTAVLEHDLVGFESIEFAGAKAVNGVAYVTDEFGQPRLVVRRNRLACRLSLRLGGHMSEATGPRAPQFHREVVDCASSGQRRMSTLKTDAIPHNDMQDGRMSWDISIMDLLGDRAAPEAGCGVASTVGERW